MRKLFFSLLLGTIIAICWVLVIHTLKWIAIKGNEFESLTIVQQQQQQHRFHQLRLRSSLPTTLLDDETGQLMATRDNGQIESTMPKISHLRVKNQSSSLLMNNNDTLPSRNNASDERSSRSSSNSSNSAAISRIFSRQRRQESSSSLDEKSYPDQSVEAAAFASATIQRQRTTPAHSKRLNLAHLNSIAGQQKQQHADGEANEFALVEPAGGQSAKESNSDDSLTSNDDDDDVDDELKSLASQQHILEPHSIQAGGHSNQRPAGAGDHRMQPDEKLVGGLAYRAPFFTSWFISTWNILFMPLFALISSCCFRNEDNTTKKLLV